MSKRTGSGTREGDWLVFCSRGHSCWASEARKKWDGHWVCEYHWEEQHPVDRLPAKAQDEHIVEATRGHDSHEGASLLGSCPRSAIVGIAIVGCAVVGVVASARNDVLDSGDPDPDKPSSFTFDSGTVSLDG